MTRATLGTCNGCGLGLNLPHRSPWHPGQHVVVMTAETFADYHRRVGILLDHLSTLDPNGSEHKHPDWPLQLRGDLDAVEALCANLNGLGTLHNNIGDNLQRNPPA